jgi:hypothetical protein
MRRLLPAIAFALLLAPALRAQPAGKFPPDSLVNVHVLPKSTPVTQVVGTMRNFAGALGVRCQHCHVGEEGQPLERFDFASDEKRTKLVARQMMRMVQDINRRLDTLPGRTTPGLAVTCATCHRGVARPVPLATLVGDVAASAGADSAIRAYRALRTRYYGRDAYDFSDFALNSAALRLGREGKFDDAFALLGLNEELFPAAASTYLFRGNVNLRKGDTAAAEAAFREALRRDPQSEARGRLRDIGRQP